MGDVSLLPGSVPVQLLPRRVSSVGATQNVRKHNDDATHPNNNSSKNLMKPRLARNPRPRTLEAITTTNTNNNNRTKSNNNRGQGACPVPGTTTTTTSSGDGCSEQQQQRRQSASGRDPSVSRIQAYRARQRKAAKESADEAKKAEKPSVEDLRAQREQARLIRRNEIYALNNLLRSVEAKKWDVFIATGGSVNGGV